jgi:hypothetical protein
MTKGAPFTEMACFVFGGDPRRLSEINDEFISYACNKFYNKISGTCLSQQLPKKLDLCRDLILSFILSGAIKEIEIEDFETFCVFGFLDNFAMPTAPPGNLPMQRHGFC